MDFFDALKQRCSVREFSDKLVAPEDLKTIIDAARMAPTARKEEPWEFIVVTQRRALEKLGELTDHGKFIKHSTACIAVACKETKYYLEDGCAATENILLAARALGIGSCWVAGDKKPYAEKILPALYVPGGYKLVSLIALGYPKKGFVVQKKRPLEEVLHRETFANK